MRTDTQFAHQDWAERHHDHKIEHVTELDACQRQQQGTF
jgi:hypothetical protein